VLAKDQIKSLAREIDRTADERIHSCDDRFDRQQLWEVVRRASRAIEAVTEMEADDLPPEARAARRWSWTGPRTGFPTSPNRCAN
jgi:hypothetical protein